MTVWGSYVGLTVFVWILMTIVDGQFTVDLRLGEQNMYKRGTNYRVCENTDVNITCFTTMELSHFTSISIHRGNKQLLNSTEYGSISVQDRLPKIEKRENYTCNLCVSSISEGKFNLTLKLTAVLPLDYLKGDEAECSSDQRKTSGKEESENPIDSKQNSTGHIDYAQDIQNNADKLAHSTGYTHELYSVNLDLFPKRFTYASKSLKFVCISKPAAPMYWAIVGEKGNILDQHNENASSIAVDTNIVIHQSLGNTSIEVLESTSGSNGIHTVICATYGSYLGVVTAHLNTPEAYSSTSLSASEESSVTREFPLRTTSTSTNDIFEVFNPQGADTNSQHTNKSIDISMAIILIGIVITILIIVGIIAAFLHQRKEKLPKDTQNDVIYDVVYHETVFTRNPAYQSYDDDDLGPPPCLPPVPPQATPCKDPGRDVYSYIDDSEKPKVDESDCELTKNSTTVS